MGKSLILTLLKQDENESTYNFKLTRYLKVSTIIYAIFDAREILRRRAPAYGTLVPLVLTHLKSVEGVFDGAGVEREGCDCDRRNFRHRTRDSASLCGGG